MQSIHDAGSVCALPQLGAKTAGGWTRYPARPALFFGGTLETEQIPKQRAKRVPSDLVADLRRRAMKSPQSIRAQAMGLAEILATLRDCRTKNRRALSRWLSDSMPADMSARAIAAVERNGDEIADLYGIFKNWIDQETEKVRIKYTACVRCAEPTRGAVAISGIGWLCSGHFRSEQIGIPHREPVDTATAIYAAVKTLKPD